MLIYLLTRILYILPYIGLAVYVIRIIILKKAPAKVPKGKKLTNELLRDCVDQLIAEDHRRHGEYTVSNSLVVLLNEDNRNYDTLKMLLNDISSHVGFKGDMFSLKVNNAIVSDRAGEIKTGMGKTVITLELKDEYDTDTIISILAHEVMHQYLMLHGIARKDVWENEILTDTAVVFTGFYTYMYRGYGLKRGGNPFSYSKVGYITQKDINYIQSVLDEYK